MKVFLIALSLLSADVSTADTISGSTPYRAPVRSILLQPNPGPSVNPFESLTDIIKDYQKTFPLKDQPGLEESEIENQYNQQGPSNDFKAATSSGPFALTAKECGESMQARSTPDHFGGKTMCGLGVARMIACMAPSIGGTKLCNGSCGDGNQFVECSNHQMELCGYVKLLNPRDERCKQAGAVLAYTTGSNTERGRRYGHVEFVCGDNKYCSVYKVPHDRPFPKSPADACWFPKSTGMKK